jgi:hypothetical protein
MRVRMTFSTSAWARVDVRRGRADHQRLALGRAGEQACSLSLSARLVNRAATYLRIDAMNVVVALLGRVRHGATGDGSELDQDKGERVMVHRRTSGAGRTLTLNHIPPLPIHLPSPPDPPSSTDRPLHQSARPRRLPCHFQVSPPFNRVGAPHLDLGPDAPST